MTESGSHGKVVSILEGGGGALKSGHWIRGHVG